MEIFTIIGIFLLITTLWLNVLATIAIKYDHTLDPFQKKAQTILVWLVPIIASGFILHLVFEHSPEAIPMSWIPWPFKQMIFGRNQKPNQNRDDNELDVYISPSETFSNHDSSDGDGGGGD